MADRYNLHPGVPTIDTLIDWAALPAAGAWSTDELRSGARQRLTLGVAYQEGEQGLGGAVDVRIRWSPYIDTDSVPTDIAEWYPLSVLEIGPVTAGATPTAIIQDGIITYTPTSGDAESFTIDIPVPEFVQRFEVSIREAGDTDAPGECSVVYALSDRGGHGDGLMRQVQDTVQISGTIDVNVTNGTLTVEGTVTGESAAGTPALYHVELTSADTEYDQALPANTKRIALQCRDDADVRMAFVTGKVAGPTEPYLTIKSGYSYDSGRINLASGTVYLASSTAGVDVELEVWS